MLFPYYFVEALAGGSVGLAPENFRILISNKKLFMNVKLAIRQGILVNPSCDDHHPLFCYQLGDS
ncbi:hypothetical protein BCH308197_B0085 (plasmid) [Bacillus cereus H3081.97]|nr:hypothetical protein BCH308197_B0085 [Bacillus cereus H3081.97]